MKSFVFDQLHIAAANGYLRVVEFLLDQHVCTDVKDSDDWQPVHAAACWGHVSIYIMLLQVVTLFLFVCFALLMYRYIKQINLN